MNWLISRRNIGILAIFALLNTGLAHSHSSSSSSSSHVSIEKKEDCKNSCKKLRRIERTLKKLSREAPRQINQKKIDKGGGTYVLSHSGDYCVTEDIIGTLVIGTDSVCLDLCCHTLNANGNANAIVADGHQGLKVYDGRIINSTDAAILVTNYSAVELFDLELNDHALDAIRQADSVNLSVHDVSFLNSNSGERALLFNSCNNITVNNCTASGFVNTVGSILELNNTNVAAVKNVDITNCTNAASEANGTLAQACFVCATECTGVDLVHVKVNNNINTNAVTFGYVAIGLLSSPSCSMQRCETSNNTNLAGGPESGDNMVLILFSDNVLVTEHQANNNACTQPYAQMLVYFSLANNTVFDRCQANNNRMDELVVSDSFFSVLSGFTSEGNNCIISNCQANFNTVANGGKRPASRGELGAIYPFWLIGNSGTVIDACQADNNLMETKGLSQSIVGYLVDVATDVTITNSSANNNTGGEVAAGMDFFRSERIVVSNCAANSNGSWGMGSDYYFFPNGPVNDLTIIDCFCNGNGGSNTHFSTGIFINGSNVLVKGCQVYDTFSSKKPATTSGEMGGIIVASAANVVIEETDIFNTASKHTKAHGILFDTLTDSKIIRTQVHGNKNSGVELVGNNSNLSIIESLAVDNIIGFNFGSASTAACSLVQDSRAINNLKAGFHYAIAPALTVTFIGNEAQCNGKKAEDNYKGLTGLINLQELKLSDGSLTSINPVGAGEAALGARFTNIRVVP